MAHSWTGNTITCRNWESFWLNEGFTVFLERKVSGQLYGSDFALVEAQLGNTSLWGDMVSFGLDTTYSSLHPVLKGDNPDNSFSEVPYEKGFQTLTYLESLVGADQFREFLRYYINANFLTSITTIELRATWEQWVEENYSAVETNQILAASNWNDWIFKSTLAPAPLDFSTQQAADA
jgi:leukotriene-A4 hydrolase